jgi:hypothetical protein
VKPYAVCANCDDVEDTCKVDYAAAGGGGGGDDMMIMCY